MSRHLLLHRFEGLSFVRRHLVVGFATIVTSHWLEARREDGALLDFLPVMKHHAVLQRALDFFRTSFDHFYIIRINCRLLGDFSSKRRFDPVNKMRRIADGVIETLS